MHQNDKNLGLQSRTHTEIHKGSVVEFGYNFCDKDNILFENILFFPSTFSIHCKVYFFHFFIQLADSKLIDTFDIGQLLDETVL